MTRRSRQDFQNAPIDDNGYVNFGVLQPGSFVEIPKGYYVTMTSEGIAHAAAHDILKSLRKRPDFFIGHGTVSDEIVDDMSKRIMDAITTVREMDRVAADAAMDSLIEQADRQAEGLGQITDDLQKIFKKLGIEVAA